MILTKIVGRIYKVVFEISLWFNLIALPIAGGVIGKELSGWGGDYTGLGVLAGLVLGFIFSVSIGGFIIKILNLDE